MASDYTQLLTEDLLLRCFPPIRYGHLPSGLREVCKRWRRACDEDPRLSEFNFFFSTYEEHRLAELYGTDAGISSSGCGSSPEQPSRSLTAGEIDVSGLVSLARRRAGVARSAKLEAAQLPGMLQAARQLTGLTALQLSSKDGPGCRQRGQDEQQPSFAEALAQHPLQLGGLTRLQRMQLDADDLQAATCRQLSELTTLTKLTVHTFVGGQVPADLWQSCAAMPGLAHLRLSVHPGRAETCTVGGGGGWAQLAGCTQLTALTVESGVPYGCGDHQVFELAPGFTALASLRHVRCDGQLAGLGDLWRHKGLTSLNLQLWCSDQDMPYLSADVDMPALRELELGGWLVPPQVPPQLLHLTGITFLQLWDDEGELEELPLLHQLHKMPHLASLRLCCDSLDSVPESVQELTSLRVLNLRNCPLTQLPPGPYLRNLHMLVLSGTKLKRLPPALSWCRGLEVLDLTESRTEPGGAIHKASQLALHPSDLLPLSRLRTLRLLCVPGSVDDEQSRTNVALATLAGVLLPKLVVINFAVEQCQADLFLQAARGAGHAALQAVLNTQKETIGAALSAAGINLSSVQALMAATSLAAPPAR